MPESRGDDATPQAQRNEYNALRERIDGVGPGRDSVRKWLAVGIFVVLAAIVLIGMGLIGYVIVAGCDGGCDSSESQSEQIKVVGKATLELLTPVVGIFGTVLGFYFASSD
ncbi:MAG: hypothetical protein ACPGO3_00175 [Magnetospiraceae bacterium]